jgi:hypothetical protein
VKELVEAVKQRKTEEAPRRASGLIREGKTREVIEALEAVIFRDHATRAIFLAHQLKTLRAAEREADITDDERPLLAAIRFLAADARERNLERSLLDALALVHEGRPPRSLT